MPAVFPMPSDLPSVASIGVWRTLAALSDAGHGNQLPQMLCGGRCVYNIPDFDPQTPCAILTYILCNPPSYNLCNPVIRRLNTCAFRVTFFMPQTPSAIPSVQS